MWSSDEDDYDFDSPVKPTVKASNTNTSSYNFPDPIGKRTTTKTTTSSNQKKNSDDIDALFSASDSESSPVASRATSTKRGSAYDDLTAGVVPGLAPTTSTGVDYLSTLLNTSGDLEDSLLGGLLGNGPSKPKTAIPSNSAASQSLADSPLAPIAANRGGRVTSTTSSSPNIGSLVPISRSREVSPSLQTSRSRNFSPPKATTGKNVPADDDLFSSQELPMFGLPAASRNTDRESGLVALANVGSSLSSLSGGGGLGAMGRQIGTAKHNVSMNDLYNSKQPQTSGKLGGITETVNGADSDDEPVSYVIEEARPTSATSTSRRRPLSESPLKPLATNTTHDPDSDSGDGLRKNEFVPSSFDSRRRRRRGGDEVRSVSNVDDLDSVLGLGPSSAPKKVVDPFAAAEKRLSEAKESAPKLHIVMSDSDSDSDGFSFSRTNSARRSQSGPFSLSRPGSTTALGKSTRDESPPAIASTQQSLSSKSQLGDLPALGSTVNSRSPVTIQSRSPERTALVDHSTSGHHSVGKVFNVNDSEDELDVSGILKPTPDELNATRSIPRSQSTSPVSISVRKRGTESDTKSQSLRIQSPTAVSSETAAVLENTTKVKSPSINLPAPTVVVTGRHSSSAPVADSDSSDVEDISFMDEFLSTARRPTVTVSRTSAAPTNHSSASSVTVVADKPEATPTSIATTPIVAPTSAPSVTVVSVPESVSSVPVVVPPAAPTASVAAPPIISLDLSALTAKLDTIAASQRTLAALPSLDGLSAEAAEALSFTREQNRRLLGEQADLRRTIAGLEVEVNRLKDELNTSTSRHLEELRSFRTRSEQELESRRRSHQDEISAMERRHAEAIAALNRIHSEEIASWRERVANAEAYDSLAGQLRDTAGVMKVLEGALVEKHVHVDSLRRGQLDTREQLLSEAEAAARLRAENTEAEVFKLRGVLQHMETLVDRLRGQNAEERDRLNREHIRLQSLAAQLEETRKSTSEERAQESAFLRQRVREFEEEKTRWEQEKRAALEDLNNTTRRLELDRVEMDANVAATRRAQENRDVMFREEERRLTRMRDDLQAQRLEFDAYRSSARDELAAAEETRKLLASATNALTTQRTELEEMGHRLAIKEEELFARQADLEAFAASLAEREAALSDGFQEMSSAANELAQREARAMEGVALLEQRREELALIDRDMAMRRVSQAASVREYLSGYPSAPTGSILHPHPQISQEPSYPLLPPPPSSGGHTFHREPEPNLPMTLSHPLLTEAQKRRHNLLTRSTEEAPLPPGVSSRLYASYADGTSGGTTFPKGSLRQTSTFPVTQPISTASWTEAFDEQLRQAYIGKGDPTIRSLPSVVRDAKRALRSHRIEVQSVSSSIPTLLDTPI